MSLGQGTRVPERGERTCQAGHAVMLLTPCPPAHWHVPGRGVTHTRGQSLRSLNLAPGTMHCLSHNHSQHQLTLRALQHGQGWKLTHPRSSRDSNRA